MCSWSSTHKKKCKHGVTVISNNIQTHIQMRVTSNDYLTLQCSSGKHWCPVTRMNDIFTRTTNKPYWKSSTSPRGNSTTHIRTRPAELCAPLYHKYHSGKEYDKEHKAWFPQPSDLSPTEDQISTGNVPTPVTTGQPHSSCLVRVVTVDGMNRTNTIPGRFICS